MHRECCCEFSERGRYEGSDCGTINILLLQWDIVDADVQTSRRAEALSKRRFLASCAGTRTLHPPSPTQVNSFTRLVGFSTAGLFSLVTTTKVFGNSISSIETIILYPTNPELSGSVTKSFLLLHFNGM